MIFDFDVIMSSNPYDTHSRVIINPTNFDVYMPCSFGEVKAHVTTHIYMPAFSIRYNVVITSPTPQDNHSVVVISRAEFDVCTPSSFRLPKISFVYNNNKQNK